MTIYKRNRSWQVHVYFSGKRVATKGGFKSKPEAKRWHDQTLGKIFLIKGDEPKVKAATFNELITKYCQTHLLTIRQGTATKYLVDIKKRINPFFNYYKLKDINRSHIDEFKSQLLRELSPKSANNCLALLKSIFKKASEWNMISKDPTLGVSLQKISERVYEWWENEEDIKKFILSARQDRFHLAYRLALDLGMRIGEIVGLTPKDA